MSERVSAYVLQVVHRGTGRVVATWPPGREAERDFIEDLCRRVREKGVGVLRTEAHVVADVRAALKEQLFALKLQVRP